MKTKVSTTIFGAFLCSMLLFLFRKYPDFVNNGGPIFRRFIEENKNDTVIRVPREKPTSLVPIGKDEDDEDNEANVLLANVDDKDSPPPYTKEDQKISPYVIPPDINEKMKQKGILLITFKQPYFMDVLDTDTADLIWTPESEILTRHPKLPKFWDKITYDLEIQRENEENIMKVEGILAEGKRKHGKYRIPNPLPGAYYVEVNAYLPREESPPEESLDQKRPLDGSITEDSQDQKEPQDGSTSTENDSSLDKKTDIGQTEGTTKKRVKEGFGLIGHGKAIFFVHVHRSSIRLSQFSFGWYKDGALKKLDNTRLKPGNRVICFTPVPEADLYRIYIYEMEKGNFHRKIYIFHGTGEEILHGPERESTDIDPKKPISDLLDDGSMQKDPLSPNSKEDTASMKTEQYQAPCINYYFFKHNDTIRPSFVFIAATAWKFENGMEIMVGWSRTSVFGYWNKFLKNILVSLAIAAIFAGYVCAWIPVGMFEVYSTLATKLYVFVRVQMVLWGGDDKCFWK